MVGGRGEGEGGGGRSGSECAGSGSLRRRESLSEHAGQVMRVSDMGEQQRALTAGPGPSARPWS